MKKKVMRMLVFVVTLVFTLQFAACASGSKPEVEYASGSKSAVEYDNGYDTSKKISANSYLSEAESSKDVELTASQEVSSVGAVSQKLIIKLDYSLETETYEDSLAALKQMTADFGGYIESSSIYQNDAWKNSSSSLKSANFVLRIPSEKMEELKEKMEEIGNVVHISETAEDITLTYSDIAAKVRTLEAERDAMVAMLEKAENISEMLEIRKYLTDVTSELEQYQSRLLVYDNLVDYITCNVSLSEVVRYTPKEPTSFFEEIGQTFMESLNSVGEFFKDFTVGLIGNLPTIITTFGLIFVCVWIVIRIVKKKKAKKNKVQ